MTEYSNADKRGYLDQGFRLFHLKDTLAQKLQHNIDAPYRQKEYSMEKYDWDAIAGQTAAVYEKCAALRPDR